MQKTDLKTEVIDQVIPLVSICCATFNHEKYIKDAIEGFLMQETDFLFEIIIHDDASTDRTSEIICEYQQKFPNLVKPILQSENQFSKGVKITAKFLFPRARGKYIALCEGDDYWIDTSKLQKQVEALQNNENCNMCIHATKIIYFENNKSSEIRPYDKNLIIDGKKIISRGGGVGHYSSIMFKKELIIKLPSFYLNAPVGDKYLRMLCASEGDTFYINELMSVYRTGLPGSWTNNNAKSQQKQIRHLLETIKTLEEFDVYTQYKYHSSIKNIKSISSRKILLKSEYKQSLIYSDLMYIKKQLNLINKIIITLNLCFPFIYYIFKSLKKWYGSGR